MIKTLLLDNDHRFVWHPYTPYRIDEFPIPIVRGEGAKLYDHDGNMYIDAISSWWVNLHGHGNSYIAKYIYEQAQRLEHVIFAGFTHEPAVLLAQRLIELSGDIYEKIFFSDDGSTAVEVALKMAWQYHRHLGRSRNIILAFENAYHGDTFGAMSVSARSIFTDPFSSLLFEVVHLPWPNASSAENTIKELEKIDKNKVAAFIFEPLIQGAGGMNMTTPAAFNKIMVYCKEQQILTIADEVMTGFGRTGKNFAMQYTDHHADIVCLSKGLTGGTMPMGATLCTPMIFEPFKVADRSKTFFHGHSYTANPLACAAALASLDLLMEKKTQERIAAISDQHLSFVKTLSHRNDVNNIRSCGTIIAWDVKNNEPSHYLNTLRDRIYSKAIEERVLLRPLGNTMYIMPPYCIKDDELQNVYSSVHRILDSL